MDFTEHIDLSIFNSGPVVIISWVPDDDIDYRVKYVTPNVKNLLGYAAEEVIRPDFEYTQTIHKDDVSRVLFAVERVSNAGESTSFTDFYRIQKKNGDIIWVSDHTHFFFENNKVVEMVGYLTDVTQFMQAKEKVEKVSREKMLLERERELKAELFASVSHEFRTPLNGIMGISELLLADETDEDKLARVDTIRTASGRLLGLVENMLDYSQLEAKCFEINPDRFNLSGFCEDIRNLLEPLALKKGLELHMEYDENLPTFILSDPLRLKQVLCNLIGNAIKFTESGFVLFKVWSQNDQVHFAVKDTGIGIKPEKIEDIFGAYSQADPSIKSEYGGTGLGLTISERLVHLLDGKLKVKSVYLRGSVFYFSIPTGAVDEHVQDHRLLISA